MNSATQELRVFLVAGEPSGDYLGAKLISALKKSYKGKLILKGTGGSLMEKAGVKSDYSLSVIAVMGIAEALPIVFTVYRLLGLVSKDIESFKPDIVITIDSPGFCFRLIKKICHIKDLYKTRFVHYVSPSVWAYNANRIKYMEKFYDLILSILPFEPLYYSNSPLECKYVGHPVLEYNWAEVKTEESRAKYGLDKYQDVIGVFPGSRIGEIKRMLPVFIETLNSFIVKSCLNTLVVFPIVSEQSRSVIESFSHDMNFQYVIIKPATLEEKSAMFKSFTKAIVKSGTSSYELSMADVPMIVAYKLNPLTYVIARYMYKIQKKIKFISLTNLLLNREVIPEYVQNNCTAEKLSEGLSRLCDPNFRANQIAQYSRMKKVLFSGMESELPSEKAARSVLELVGLVGSVAK